MLGNFWQELLNVPVVIKIPASGEQVAKLTRYTSSYSFALRTSSGKNSLKHLQALYVKHYVGYNPFKRNTLGSYKHVANYYNTVVDCG